MDFLHSIFGNDLNAAFFIILNLIVIESLLSVDNAAVLATMVMDLPEHQRGKALKYGIIGAYVFRGICLLAASWLVSIWWLKPLGGLYLLWLSFDYFKTLATPTHEDDLLNKQESWIYKNSLGLFGLFWATVILVEVMDLAFSIDNVLAAVAFTENIYLIWIGVFIGILSMRFVATAFVKLMEKFPFLEMAAFIVIGILGIKLSFSLYTHFVPHSAISIFLEGEIDDKGVKISHGEKADLLVSLLTVAIFVLPVISSLLFGWPGKKKSKASN